MKNFLRVAALAICTLIVTANANAQIITADRAQEIANSFFSSGMQKSAAARSVAAAELTTSLDSSVLPEVSSSEEPTFHIITPASGKGFVIVAGEEMENPIIGYSMDGTIDTNDLPVGFVDYMTDIDAQVKALRKYNAENPKKASAARKARKKAMQKTNYAATTMGNIVQNLNTAPWGQNAPFNNLCYTTSGAKAKTGCGPTAFAILCHYYKWPATGTGTVTHNSETLDLSSHTYDYENMLSSYNDTYTEEEATAVATLMRDLGYAFKVTYGTENTGFSEGIASLKSYFSFNNSMYNTTGMGMDALYRSDTTDEEFIQKIKDCLDQNYPIPFSSSVDDLTTNDVETSRHIYILDGYTENNYFHFNWGWHGAYNGWFTLDAMNLSDSTGYSNYQRIYLYVIPNATKRTVTATANPSDQGTVSINGGIAAGTATGEYTEGLTVTLTATANTGYTFSHWSKDDATYSTDKSCTAKVASSGNDYVANFLTVGNTTVNVEVTYDSSKGSVTNTSGTVTSGTTLTPYQNAEFTLTAAPAIGYIFSGWTVTQGTESTNYSSAELTLVATGEMTVTANFALAEQDYVVTPDTGTLNNGTNRSSTWTFTTGGDYLAELAIKATDSSSNVVNSITNKTSGSAGHYFNSTGIIENTETSSTAPTIYTISVPSGYKITGYSMTYYPENGSITVSNDFGHSETATNSSADYYMNANGINVQSTTFTVNGSGRMTTLSFTVTVKKDDTDSGETPVTQYTITASASPATAGTATANGSSSVTVDANSTVTLNAVANTGYEFVSWTNGTSTISNSASCTVTATAKADYVANFQTATPTTFAVTTAANPAEGGTAKVGVGTNSPATSATVNSGTEVTLYAEENDGYNFVNWTKGGVQVSTDATCNVTITEASNYVANFEAQAATTTYTITATANPAEGGSVTGAGTYAEGATVTLIATANEGYTFKDWTSGTNTVSTDATYSFTANATANTDFVANFEAEASTPTEDLSGRYFRVKGGDIYLNIDNNTEHTTGASGGVNMVAKVNNSNTQIFLFEASGNGYKLKSLSGYYIKCQQWNVDATSTESSNGTELIFESTGNELEYIISWENPNDNDYFMYGTADKDESGTYYPYCNATESSAATWVLEEVTLCTVTATVNPSTAGTATVGVGTNTSNEATVESGTEVTLTAAAGTDYTFAGWYDGGTLISTDTPYAFTANSTTTLTANFEPKLPITGTKLDATFNITDNGNTNQVQTATEPAITINSDGNNIGFYTVDGVTRPCLLKESYFTISVPEPYRIAGYKLTVEGHNFDDGTITYTTGAQMARSNTATETIDSEMPTTVIATGLNNSEVNISVGTSSSEGTPSGVIVTGLEIDYVAQYTITATANPTEGGNVTGAGTYTEGTTVTLSATAADGYEFVNWTKNGNDAGSTTSITVTVDADAEYIANFQAQTATTTYTITTAANPAEGGSVTGAGTYAEGATVTLIATANEGYTFKDWTSGTNTVSTDATYSFTANATANTNFVANFEKEQQAGGTDTVYNIVTNSTTGEPTEANGSYYKVWTSKNSPKIVLTSPDYTIYNNTSELRLRAATYTLSLDNSVDEDLQIVSYTINYEKNAKASSITLSATGEEDQTPGETTDLQSFAVDSFDPTRSTSFTVTTGALSQTIWVKSIDVTIRSSVQQYTVTTTANPTDGGTVTGGGTYNDGETATLTATPNANYSFVNWTKGGEVVSTSATFTQTVNADAEYVANFNYTGSYVEIAATVSTIGGGEGGSVTGTGNIIPGKTATLTAVANTGYRFKAWYNENGEEISTEATYEFTADTDATYRAEFIKQIHVVIIQPKTTNDLGQEDEGYKFAYTWIGSTIDYDVYVDYDTEVALNVTVYPEFNGQVTFAYWSRNGEKVSQENPYTFTATEDSYSFLANFDYKAYVAVEAGDGNGAVSIDGESEPTAMVAVNNTVTIVAEANSGYTLDRWVKVNTDNSETTVSTTATYTFVFKAEFDETVTYKAYFRKITELEDGKAYRIKARMSDGTTYRYIYRDATGIKWNESGDLTNNSIFIAQYDFKANDGSLNLISAVGDLGWNYEGTLGETYVALKTEEGIAAGTFTLYNVAIVGTGESYRSYTAYSSDTEATSGNIGVYTYSTEAHKVVDSNGSTDFVFEEVPFKFDVKTTDGSNAKLGTINLPFATTVHPSITVYQATSREDNWVHVAPLALENNILPANTPVLIEADEAGTYGFVPAPASNVTYDTGFAGTLKAKPIDEATNAYILSYKGTGTEIKFYKLSSSDRTINANKAYYIDETGNVATLSFKFVNTTGVEESKDEIAENKVIYDLQGRKLSEITVPGIYIINGVKRIVR